MISLLSTSTGIGYRNFIKPILFRFDPERAHDLATRRGEKLGQSALARRLVRSIYRYDHPVLSQTIAGIKFDNPVGLSAGFDKDGRLTGILEAIGFGSAEIGTVTWQPYGGNPRPRLYRLLKSEGIVVNYGLKNEGVEAIGRRLKNQFRPPGWPIGISIGKTNCRETAEEQVGINDYGKCLEMAAANELGDWYTINISCPNTFGGEPFTTADKLERLLAGIDQVRPQQPLWLKMPINLPWIEFKTLLEVAAAHQITGVVIGNLNKNYQDPSIKEPMPPGIKGGISGKPTQRLVNGLISQTYQAYGNKLLIIGVGGIFSAADAYEKIKRGASLVQLVTGMIFKGPQLIGQINRELVKYLQRDKYNHISEAVGAAH